MELRLPRRCGYRASMAATIGPPGIVSIRGPAPDGLQTHGGAARVVCADWRRLPFRKRFDLIVASDVLYEERWIDPILDCIEQFGGAAWIAGRQVGRQHPVTAQRHVTGIEHVRDEAAEAVDLGLAVAVVSVSASTPLPKSSPRQQIVWPR